jgi:2-oxoisovalerate dehydrogenase E2 component (dihydrolipoyl transacylase)
MPTFVMPQLGESDVEGTVIRWLKQPGELVRADEPLVEVETEKVNVEIPSPFAGTLTEILVPAGQTVPVGTPLAVIGEAVPAATPAALAQSAGGAVATAAPTSGGDGRQPVSAAPPVRGEGRYSPAVLRLAQEHGLDLRAIPGTGLGGRVTRKDVLRFLEQRVEQRAAQPAPTPTVTPTPAEPAPSPPPAAAPTAGPRLPAPTAVPPAAEDEEVITPSPTRLTIARNMLRAAQTIPAAWMAVEVDVTRLVQLRGAIREEFRRREGVDLTYLPFVIQATAQALKEHPLLNSQWRDDHIVLKKRINIGVAVATDEGLIVPVIHDADRLSIAGLAHALADLAQRARARRLRLEDVQGGTFTIDNTGVFGSIISRPIINPPQCAILTTEAIVPRPVVMEDAIAIRSLMNLCIAFDHRIVDGSHVGPFMQRVKKSLEAYGPDTPVY